MPENRLEFFIFVLDNGVLNPLGIVLRINPKNLGR